MDINIVGGGLAGLTAAVAAAERGANVTLYESHETLGGRARSSSPPHVANEGPHVLYAGRPMRWLEERGLLPPVRRMPAAALAGARAVYGGRLAVPPAGMLWAAARRGLRAPVDEDFASWATGKFGAATAQTLGKAGGVALMDHDPGRLSAAFVWDRFQRATTPGPPPVFYVLGGWTNLVEHMARRARAMGVRIETGARVTELPVGPPGTPVVVATSLASARSLLGDESLTWESGHTFLLDLGLRSTGREPSVVFDLDGGGFVERYTCIDPTLAPRGEELVQAQMPVRPGERRAEVVERLEGFLDTALPGWGDRVTWRREQEARGRSGALDLPGTTWRDRPAVDRGGGVYLAGDSVAAPGLLGEVSITSAVAAVNAALSREPVRAPAA
ncbi:NAD(P)-binding protein [Nocardiopsis sp. HNM0947]|uniref:NAD(P)-binding protein n=1 Tax=Nocardiopsis coralli TaxID=2772213 RepID=A0ABR9P996_9ACTN|nr:FAD-dependent oxidoreductase [Nocardiopsis coralli]MBE3000416.1 NAD(P)-binding protein [Nocardiopsis coralli]